MRYQGKCQCGQSRVFIETPASLHEYNPRVCDCEYCQSHPSAVISAPEIAITVRCSAAPTVRKNGDQLASFFHCSNCNNLLAVGRHFSDGCKGAVNSHLLLDRSQLGQPVAIKPRLLSAEEKLARWGSLWGCLHID